MGDDEVLVFVVSAALAIVALVRWYVPVVRLPSLLTSAPIRLSLLFTPLICLAFLLFILMSFADHQVRENWGYILLFITMGAACLGVANLVLLLTGISSRDDSLERRNAPATTVVCAALVSTVLCFAGANIGEGPTIWTTIGPAALGLGTLFSLWVLHAGMSSSSKSITIDRDFSTALRRAGFYIATGLILGQAVAGNWVSIEQTWTDFIHASWPVAILFAGACAMDRIIKPKHPPTTSSILAEGWAPAAIYLLIALVDVMILAGRVHQ